MIASAGAVVGTVAFVAVMTVAGVLVRVVITVAVVKEREDATSAMVTGPSGGGQRYAN